MSRIVYLRSPYFVKASAAEGKTLSSAQLDLYIWKGKLEDQPTTPTYSLQKSTEDSTKNYVVFEISELCRDELEYTFNGKDRKTEPVYINWELTNTNTDGTSTIYSDVVFGLDGYLNQEQGLQVSENLFEAPGVTEAESETSKLSISIEDSESGKANREFDLGARLSLSATYTPTAGTLQWFKDDVAISGATSATYTVATATAAAQGTYFCRVLLNAGLSNETSEDSNKITWTEASCAPLYFMPDAQGSTYLSFGGAKSSSRTISWQFDTSCYSTVTASDVTFSRGSSSPFTVHSVATAAEGSIQRTTVTIRTRHKYVGTGNPDRDRINITYTDETLGRQVTKGINLQQVSSEGALTDIYLSQTGIDSDGGDVTVYVAGGVGRDYNLLVYPIVEDEDEDGRLDDEADYRWISNSALSSVSGTISETGTNQHTLTIPANTTSVQRQLIVIANDGENDRVNTGYLTQDSIVTYAYLQLADVAFASAASSDQTITYFANEDVELAITKGSDAFKFVLPQIDNGGSPPVIYEPEKLTSILYASATPTGGSTVTVRAATNDIAAREGTVSIKPRDWTRYTDTLALSQPGTADFCIFQNIIATQNNRTNQGTLNVGSGADGVGLGYWFYINSSQPWEITGIPSDCTLYLGSLGNGGRSSTLRGEAGKSLVVMRFDADNGNTDTTFTLTVSTVGLATEITNTMVVTRDASISNSAGGPVIGSYTIHPVTRTSVTQAISGWTIDYNTTVSPNDLIVGNGLNGYAIQAEASDTNSGTLEFAWYHAFNDDTNNRLQLTENILDKDHTDDVYCIFPTAATSVKKFFTVTNATTDLSSISDFIPLRFNLRSGSVGDWVRVTSDHTAIPGVLGAIDHYNVAADGDTFTFEVYGVPSTFSWTVYSAFSAYPDIDVTQGSTNTVVEWRGTFTGPGTCSITFPRSNKQGSNTYYPYTILTNETGYVANYKFPIYQLGQPIAPVISGGGGGGLSGLFGFGSGLSNAGASNATGDTFNGANTVEEDQENLLQNLDNPVILGGAGGGTPITNVDTNNDEDVTRFTGQVVDVSESEIDSLTNGSFNVILEEKLSEEDTRIPDEPIEPREPNTYGTGGLIQNPTPTPAPRVTPTPSRPIPEPEQPRQDRRFKDLF